MNKESIENKVKTSFDNATPQIYDTIARDVASLNVNRTPTRRPRSNGLFWKIASGVLSLVLVVMAIVGIVSNVNQTARAATVSLDVNPSVQIVLNRNNRVVKVKALNADGEVIIADMDFSGCQLKVAVNALIGSMLRAGYLSSEANSVLVSVDSSKNAYQSIAEAVANEITVTLGQMSIDASVVSQWIQNDDEIAAIAKQYNISLGKAQLISKIVAKSDYTVEQLVELTVNELSLLLPNVGIDEGDVAQSGTASDKKYIEQTEALNKALVAARVEELSAETTGLKVYKTKLDFDDGEMVYDVEYTYGNYIYEVEVGAISGEIVAFLKSLNSYYALDTETKFIANKDEAKIFALTLARVDSESVENAFAEQMWYYHGTVYEVTFNTEDMIYQYCIGSDGTVIEEYYEMLSLSAADSYLAREDVVDWFLANNTDGFTRLDSQNGRMRVYSEKTVDGRLVYELSFVSNGNKYVYKIDAVNQVILSREVSEYDSNGSGGSYWDDDHDHAYEHDGGHDWFWDDWYWDDHWDSDWDFDWDGGHYGEPPHGHRRHIIF